MSVEEKQNQTVEEEKKESLYENLLEENEKVKEEKVLTVNLRDAKKAPKLKRAKRAIKELKENIMRYTKLHSILIHNKINELIWLRSAKKPPSKIKVKIIITDKNKAIILPIE
jgi:Ribosomal protein L31E